MLAIDFIKENPSLFKNYSGNGLRCLKYAPKVFYEDLWDLHPILKDSRGLVVDIDMKPLSIGFRKIFNHNEKPLDIVNSSIVRLHKKTNGFMFIVTPMTIGPDHVPYLFFNTNGSTSGDYVNMGIENFSRLNYKYLHDPKFLNISFIFEIVDPRDPHIIEEDLGVYLLGARLVPDSLENIQDHRIFNTEDLIDIAGQLGCYPPMVEGPMLYETALERLKHCQHEGYVVETEKGNQWFKLKSDYYIISKTLARVPTNKLKSKLEELLERFPDYDYVFHTVKTNFEYFSDLEEQERLEYLRGVID